MGLAKYYEVNKAQSNPKEIEEEKMDSKKNTNEHKDKENEEEEEDFRSKTFY